MYTPKHFAETDSAAQALMRDHPFATLISSGEGGPTASHLPLILDSSRGPHGTLRGHMARANPQWQSFAGATGVLVIFQGPHAYISPAWYGADQAVPTWNYSAVHAYGTPRVIEAPGAVRALLEDQVALFESGFEQPWDTTGLEEGWLAAMIRGVVAFEIEIARIEAKAKLSQNRPADQARVAAALERLDGPLNAAVAREILAHPPA